MNSAEIGSPLFPWGRLKIIYVYDAGRRDRSAWNVYLFGPRRLSRIGAYREKCLFHCYWKHIDRTSFVHSFARFYNHQHIISQHQNLFQISRFDRLASLVHLNHNFSPSLLPSASAILKCISILGSLARSNSFNMQARRENMWSCGEKLIKVKDW